MNKKVCVIGLGYIGLPTASILASSGFDVAGCDVNPHVVESVNNGECHIVEPGLDQCLKEAIKSKKLKAFEYPSPADIYILCVPTPFKNDIKSDIPCPNIDYVMQAAQSIIPHLKEGDIVILESTSPVGTTEKIAKLYEKNNIDIESLNIAYCPERVLPGNIMKELINNDRIIGGINGNSCTETKQFYETFVKGNIYLTDTKTAELCKLTENSFRDLNIAFANQLSLICEEENVNVKELIDLANKHPRVNVLSPGIGVGGHCIPVDPWFIISKNPKNSELLKLARNVNNEKTSWIINKIEEDIYKYSEKNNIKPKVACLGLSYKPNIDDLRCSPAEEIVNSLNNKGYDLMVVEPNVPNHPDYNIFSLNDALKIADIFFILVGHEEFKSTNFKDRKVIDFCGILDDVI
tara:strand:- start:9535 stop:10755 length:1221 start_codon:yes stop_codon:yes gene_type:complete